MSEGWIELAKKFSSAMSGHTHDDTTRACGWLVAQLTQKQSPADVSVTLARVFNVASRCEGRDFLSE